jgi:hypothetical protein
LDPAGGPAKLTIGRLVDSDLDGFPGPNTDGDDKSIPAPTTRRRSPPQRSSTAPLL